PQHVDVGVQDRLLHRLAYISLGRLVHDHVEAFACEQFFKFGVEYVRLLEVRARVEVWLAPGGEVVDDDHCVARLDERVGDMRADETCAAGHEYLHAVCSSCWGVALSDTLARTKV